ncbi:methyltransferase domain-containing protein [Parvibaculum sedimenti]|uniref:methyltransferase domain-containing protein n=1 Tax=Parvibaculum sedimenti TaxID=2608632 RepID=UPI003CCCE10F
MTWSSFPDGHFEAILIIEVLEHVVDPRRATAEAAPVLFGRATQEPDASFFSVSLILAFTFALLPIALLVAKLMPTDFATTGYVLSGREPSGKLD